MYKIASVGNSFLGTELVNFDSAISLTDFDIVIIDPVHVGGSFPKFSTGADNRRNIRDKDAHILLDLMTRRKSEISALVNNGRMIVSFLAPLFDVVVSSPRLDKRILDNYSWISGEALRLFTHRIVDGLGTNLRCVNNKHLFSPYYFALQKELIFSAYVNDLTDNFKYGEPFIVNSANQIAGFTCKVSNGLMVFLPYFNMVEEENAKKFIGVLLQIAKKYFGTNIVTPPPAWTKSFAVPGVKEIQRKIDDIGKEIENLSLMKKEKERGRDDLENYKFLLYEQGHVLESKVVDAFKLLGFNAETIPTENTDFDVVLQSEEGRAIAEVEGKDDSAVHKDKIDQLLSAINQDAEGKDVFAKGVLVGNHFRLKPVNERGQPFTETVIRLAKQYRYALITTDELFAAAVYFLENPEDETMKKACRMAIFETDGEVVQFPLPKQ